MLTGQTGHVDDEKLEKAASHSKTLTRITGILFILIASFMSASIGVLNRSLKEVPYAVVLFYHSFFGIFVTTTYLATALTLTNRPLYVLEFDPFDNVVLFGATCLDAISVMSQTIAF